MKIEHKLLGIRPAEVKFDTDQGVIKGYASVFNGVDSYGDTIVKGAFLDTLQNRERPIQMRWNHFGPVVGKWIKAEENDKGLYMEGQLTPGHSTASDVKASIAHGAIDGLSIGFYVEDAEDRDSGRVIKRVSLVEVSIVEEPADLQARISDMKSAIEGAETLAELERLLRDVGGFSVSHAKTLVSRVKTIACRDGGQEAVAQYLEQARRFRASL